MRTFTLALLLALSLALPACTTRSGPRPSGGIDGGGTVELDSGATPFEDAAIVRNDTGMRPSGDCTESARWIYLVDSGNALLRFEPDSGTLTPIGTLSCPSGGATPFSMAVDRSATAFVLHSDHRIYQVSTADASCTATTFVPNQVGFELFGMGFVSDSEGSTLEHLFIAGGPEAGIGGGSATLGRIDFPAWSVASIGPVTGSPELTGTGTGELWGFFPDSTPMSVREIAKSSGATLREIDVSAVDSSGFGLASAWAFAFWGGRFYMFYQGALDSSSGIYRVTPDTGVVETVRMNIGYRIVGAGVSTCAPTILI
ncbi:MAG: hypothetical protein M3Y87_24910 [Myxococcota bacterium]|nr:hypothetical protein [Myxococcota bacterium]